MLLNLQLIPQIQHQKLFQKQKKLKQYSGLGEWFKVARIRILAWKILGNQMQGIKKCFILVF